MVVDLPVAVVAGHHIVFNGVDAAFLDHHKIIFHPQGPQDAFQVKMAVGRSGKVGIPQEIVHPVRIELRGNQLRKKRVCGFVTDDIRHFMGQSGGGFLKYFRNLRIFLNDAAGKGLMVLPDHLFKGMGIRAVSDIMKQARRKYGHLFPLVQGAFNIRNFRDHPADNFIYAKRMRKPGMVCRMVNHEGAAELTDPPHPLHPSAVDQLPDHFIFHAVIRMHGIAQYFYFIRFLKCHLMPPQAAQPPGQARLPCGRQSPCLRRGSP